MYFNVTPHRPLSESVGRAAQKAAEGADQAIRSTQRFANETLDHLSDTVQRTPAAVRETATSAERLAMHSAEALQNHAHDLRYQALMASQQARQKIQHDPLTSVVLAAALGAGLTALWFWLARRPASMR